MPYQPRATSDNPYGPQVAFRTEDVLPPGALYVSPQDNIQVVAFASQLNQLLILTIRLLTPDGEVKVEQYQTNVTQTLAPTFPLNLSPTEGYILGAVVYAPQAAQGQCFVQVRLAIGGPNAAANLTTILMQGYPSAALTLTYPPPTLQAFFEGAGWLSTVQATPVAAANFQFTVPAETRWQVYSINATLTTDGTVGNRSVALQILDASSHQMAYIECPFQPTASTVTGYTWASGFPAQHIIGNTLLPLPTALVLPAGYQITGLGANIGPGDRWGPVTLYKEEWVGF